LYNFKEAILKSSVYEPNLGKIGQALIFSSLINALKNKKITEDENRKSIYLKNALIICEKTHLLKSRNKILNDKGYYLDMLVCYKF